MIIKASKKLIDFLLATLVAVMTLLVAIAVVYRYGFNQPLLFSFELTTAFFVWIVFLGMAHTYLKGGHLGLEIIDNYLPLKAKQCIDKFRVLVVGIISVYIATISFPIALNTSMKMNSLGVSAKFLYLSVPIGFSLLAIVCVGMLIGSFRNASADNLNLKEVN